MTEQLQMDLDAAIAAADRGIEAVALSNEEFVYVARRIAIELGIARRRVTADDVREACARRGIEPKSYNAWGAIFRDGNWEPKGFTRSKQVQGHGNIIREWEYKYRG